MKKRVFSILIALTLMLAFASAAMAEAVVVAPPTGTPGQLPNPGASVVQFPDTTAGHHLWQPGSPTPWQQWPGKELKPNPLPSNAQPLPSPNGPPTGPVVPGSSISKLIQDEIKVTINELAKKYNTSMHAIWKYMYVTQSSYTKLSSKDQKTLKSLMLKMAAKEIGISAKKLDSELTKAENDLVKRLVSKTGLTSSQVRSQLHVHACNCLIYKERKGDKHEVGSSHANWPAVS